jgi:hypothetical protein
MLFLKTRIKKIIAISAGILICLFSIPQLKADIVAGGDAASIYLPIIAQHTNDILTALTSVSNPVVQVIVSALTSLTSPDSDSTSPTPALQSAFTNYVTQSAKSNANQIGLQTQLTTDFFGTVITPTTMPSLNDESFLSLLGTPFISPDPRNDKNINPAYNFLRNASGLAITHPVPSPSWNGTDTDKIRYNNYFTSLIAAQTFNAYLLSQYYSDATSPVPAAQTDLINQASDPNTWFKMISTESIGAVLRQILMYNSQSYILQAQTLQIEKQLLAAMAINNTLSIVGTQASESLLVRRAIVQMKY